MLKQGVLPSVFPWNKSKVLKKTAAQQVIKAVSWMSITKISVYLLYNLFLTFQSPTVEPKPIKQEIKQEPIEKPPSPLPPDTSLGKVKEEPKSPSSTTIEQKIKSIDTPTGPLSFTINTKIEALDFNQKWCPAKIIEIDYEENEVLIHFEDHSTKYEEWICMNSNALRAYKEEPVEVKKEETAEMFGAGDKCMAFWRDAKFPAEILKVLGDGT